MKPMQVFISYSHRDEIFKDQLIAHLSGLKRREIIKEWHDRKLIAGEEWDGKIKQELIDSEIILLLISSDFLASKYSFDVEIQKAMERHERKDAIVIPIILRPCDWKDLPFSKIQGLPKDAKPLSTWSNLDEGFLNIIEGIKSAIQTKPEKELVVINSDKSDSIKFDRDVIVGRLPRGYIVIEDIEFQEYSSWAVTASYFDYSGNWMHGTHYHDSYHRRWDSPEGQESQCAKLNIPKGDWSIAESALYLVMKTRERKKEIPIEDILVRFQGKYEFFTYRKAGDVFPKPVIPELFLHLNKTGEIRDIIDYLSFSSWKNYDLSTLRDDCDSYRRKAYLLVYEKLGVVHPILGFIKEIVDSYRLDYSIDQLREWGDRLSDALADACNYIK
jgi:hypothetical protein